MLTPRTMSLLKLAAGVARDALLLAGLLAFVAGVIFLLYTRWGRSRPLVKCMVLSALAHVMLLAYLPTVSLIRSVPRLSQQVFEVALYSDNPQGQGTDEDFSAESDGPGEPWEGFSHEHVAQPRWQQPARLEHAKLPEATRTTASPSAPLPAPPTVAPVLLTETVQPSAEQLASRQPAAKLVSIAEAEPIQAPAAQRRQPSVSFGPPVEGPGRRGGDGGATGFHRITSSGGGLPESLLVLPETPRITDLTAQADPPDGLARLPQQRSSSPSVVPVDPAGQGGEGEKMAFGEEAFGPSSAATIQRPSNGTAAQESAGAATGQTGGWMPAAGSKAGSVSSPGGRQSAQGTADSTSPLDATAGQGGQAVQEAEAPQGGGARGEHAGLIGPPRLPGLRRGQASTQSMPELYRLRVSPERSAIAQQKGATPETEAAVKLALKWLAGNQEPTGRWDPRQHGAGQERQVQGRNRQGAGIDADTGVTGLALLAMLGAGNTHLQGEYRENVRRGLEYLMRSQASDGNLAGPATGYARMYCHAIALFALSEAYGMTGDARLEPTVRRGVAYTLAAQNPTTGGWRYVPGDTGDTSMFGWQIIALKSAELAGVPIPDKNRSAAIRYLRSVASGRSYGLASYRPGEPPSRPMTAEALVCWQFLGMPREHPAGKEAGDYLLQELPSTTGTPNLYYWYYATLGMFQLQGIYWEKWNAAMRDTLVALQHKTGPLAGSWDTNTVWGGYGGRVYTTSMATLCLEVYYRYLPLYAEAAGQDRAR